jgi:hypothetical protein
MTAIVVGVSPTTGSPAALPWAECRAIEGGAVSALHTAAGDAELLVLPAKCPAVVLPSVTCEAAQ